MKKIQYFNDEGMTLIDSEDDPPNEFRVIPPDASIQRLADIVCK